MSLRQEGGNPRLDEAARAGWLYYVAGNTQDQIAGKLGVSRQTAQRLVSLAVSEGLIKVRVDHPIANCLELARRLTARFALDLAEVVPSSGDSSSTTIGIAEAAAGEIERWLRSTEPIVMAIGTGRTLKAAIEQLAPRGVFVSKVFQGGAQGELLELLKANFAQVRHWKPPASRPESPETFVIARGFHGSSAPAAQSNPDG